MTQFLFCFSDEPSGTWVRASWTLWFIHPIPAQRKFIPFSTWPRVGKTFHPGVFLYLNGSKTSSRLITANKVVQRTIRFYYFIKTSFKVDTEGWYCVKKGNISFSSLLLCFRSAGSLSVNFMSDENLKWKFKTKKIKLKKIKLNSWSNNKIKILVLTDCSVRFIPMFSLKSFWKTLFVFVLSALENDLKWA